MVSVGIIVSMMVFYDYRWYHVVILGIMILVGIFMVIVGIMIFVGILWLLLVL